MTGQLASLSSETVEAKECKTSTQGSKSYKNFSIKNKIKQTSD
jgi:hypothetical protein